MLDRSLPVGYTIGNRACPPHRARSREETHRKPPGKEYSTMSTPTNGRRGQSEQPNTYFVQDRHQKEELTRLTIQEQFITRDMGGVMPEQPDPGLFRRVLDVGCGPGGWLIETARTYPAMTSLLGIDVSSKMVEYARTQASPLGLENRVQFVTMDALKPLEFPPESFDLVNQRLGWSFLRTWDWLKLLVEYQRVACAGGVIPITENQAICHNTSPTLSRLFSI